MKNLSFGKLVAIFGGLFVVIMIGTLVFLKIQAANKGAFVPTKVYKNSPAEQANASAQQGPTTPQQAALQVPSQAAMAPSQAATQQGTQNPFGATPMPQTTSAAGPAPTATAPNQNVPQATSGDMGSQLAAIDAKLTRFDARISALETRSPSAAGSVPSGQKNASAARIAPSRRAAHRTPPASKLKELAKTEPMVRDAQGYKSMAVVGNRAWVSLPDGSEATVTAGEVIPQPRPRVRSVDINSGVIITSNDERINAH